MNGLVKTLFVSFLLWCAVSNIQAQEKKKELAVTSGFAVKIVDPNGFDSSHCFHLGLNMYNRNARKISTDAQLSFNYTSDKFISSEHLTVNALYGGRMYFSAPENNTRIFMNLLAGFAFRSESGDDFVENLPDIGYSGGIFMERSLLIGSISGCSFQSGV